MPRHHPAVETLISEYNKMAKKVVRNESHRRKVQRKNERRQFSEELKSGKIDTLVGSTTGKKKKNKLVSR